MDGYSFARAPSGIAGLDDVLAGGFPREQMCLVEGNPGAGKSTLALQFLLAGARAGERVLYVALAETEREVRRLAASHGWPLDGVTIVEGVSRDLDGGDYTLFHPAEVELEEASRSIFRHLDETRPARVAFDSLSELRLLAQDRLRYRRQLLALKAYLQHRGITALLLDFLSDDDRQLASLCHGIVSLEQLSPEYGGHRRRLRIKKLRESEFRDGYHDFAIRKGGLEVFPRLVAAEHPPGGFRQETTSTGLSSLDALLGGGLDRGTSTLLLGPAGAGKSTLAAQCVKAALDRGESAALFIFDEVPNTYVVRAEGLGLGLAEHIRSGRVSLRQVDPAQMTPGEFAHSVRAAVEQAGARIVVIDSLNGYTSSMPEERYLHAHLHELLAYLNQKAVVSLLVMTQQGIVGTNVAAPLELSYLADTVLLLRYFEARAEVRQAISVVKRRTGPHERTVREFRLTPAGIAIGSPLHDFHGVLTGNLSFDPARKEAREEGGDGR